jgi:enoyl-CoA hydratase/carnithine racemase
MATYNTLIVERRGPVEWITFNRPERLNAINGQFTNELADRFEALQEDESCRVVVLRGAGRAFCAGLDIKDYEAYTANGPSWFLGGRLPEIIVNMRKAPQPIVSLVHGAACGGGMAFALASDIRIAAESMRMNDAFSNFGVTGSELGITYFLPRIVGVGIASELMLTGKFIDAQRALQTNLVSRVVPDDQLEAAGQQIVDEMLHLAPVALRKQKEVLWEALGVDDLEAVIQKEYRAQVACMPRTIGHGNADEGRQALLEKRAPEFTGTWRG